jgi:hypothetical protein
MMLTSVLPGGADTMTGAARRLRSSSWAAAVTAAKGTVASGYTQTVS